MAIGLRRSGAQRQLLSRRHQPHVVWTVALYERPGASRVDDTASCEAARLLSDGAPAARAGLDAVPHNCVRVDRRRLESDQHAVQRHDRDQRRRLPARDAKRAVLRPPLRPFRRQV